MREHKIEIVAYSQGWKSWVLFVVVFIFVLSCMNYTIQSANPVLDLLFLIKAEIMLFVMLCMSAWLSVWVHKILLLILMPDEVDSDSK